MKFNNIYACIWIDNYFYILKNNNTIEIYDNKLVFIKDINIKTEYNSIAYNDKEKQLYFSKLNNNQILYKSSDFKTFKFLDLNLPIKCNEVIKHISYCKRLDSIIITTRKKVLLLNLSNNCVKILYQEKEKITEINDCTRPFGYNINSDIILIAAICCSEEILVAYRFNEVSYIAKLKDGNLDEIIYKTNDFIESMFIAKQEVWIVIAQKGYQELINTKIECNCSHSKNCDCQIIESIASIEKSIAKILDSESLKIKIAIDKSEDVNDLICINSSVREVIYYITILEFILTEKLKAIKKENDIISCNKNTESLFKLFDKIDEQSKEN